MKYNRGGIFLAAPLLLSLIVTGCADPPPAGTGMLQSRLAPCPESPNCVSSMAEDERHFIAPLNYDTDKKTAYGALLQVLSRQSRVTIVKQSDNYLHAEFRSKLFRFVDDVAFYFPKDETIIHVRSASRKGYSDLGVNRKRVEKIRAQFNKLK